ncbi:MAG: hypothetical protein U0527_05155 [Candidatus Eisenbacteria bacterium]
MASDNHPDDGHWVELAESISDGTPIDWQKEAASVASADDAALLGQLRLVAGIAEVHRSVHARPAPKEHRRAPATRAPRRAPWAPVGANWSYASGSARGVSARCFAPSIRASSGRSRSS